jgi:hypothetical protein
MINKKNQKSKTNMNDNKNDVNYYDTYWVNRFMSGVDVSSETQKQIEELSAKVAALESK